MASAPSNAKMRTAGDGRLQNTVGKVGYLEGVDRNAPSIDNEMRSDIAVGPGKRLGGPPGAE